MYIKVGEFVINLNYMVALSLIGFVKWFIGIKNKKKNVPNKPGQA